jgi:hypothetical protein
MTMLKNVTKALGIAAACVLESQTTSSGSFIGWQTFENCTPGNNNINSSILA